MRLNTSITLLLEITSPAALHTLDPTVRFPSVASSQRLQPSSDPVPSFSSSPPLSSLPDDVTLQQVSNTKRAINATEEFAATTRAQTVEVGFSHYFSLSLGWGEGTAQVWQRPPLTDSTPASSARPSADPAGWREAPPGPGAERGGSAGLPTGRTPLGPEGSEAMSQGPRQPLLPLRQVFRVGFLTPLSVLRRADGEVPGSPF